MDGESVTGQPSDPAVPASFTEIFYKYCPHYLAMGMTWDEYWHNNTKVHAAYREAFEMRRQRKNWEQYMMGAYVFDAMVRVAPMFRSMGGGGHGNIRYLDEPYPLTQREAREREERRERENYRRYIEMRREASDREKKRRAEEAKKGADGDG